MNRINPYSAQPSDSNRAKGKAMAEAISGIFQTLRAHYPKYSMFMKTEKQELGIMQEWGVALAKSGVDQKMLKNGIERAKSYAVENQFCNWPSLSDFISWCHGIPSPESAYFETMRNCHDLTVWEPTHPIVAIAGRHTGYFDMLNSKDQKMFKTEYVRKYSELVVRASAGEKFTYQKLAKPIQIEKKDLTPAEMERSRDVINELKRMVEEDKKKKPVVNSISAEDKAIRIKAMRKQMEALKGKSNEK